MKILILFFFCFNLLGATNDKEQSAESMIGPTIRPPILYKNNIFFLSASGILFKAKKNLKKPEKLFQTKFPTASPLVLEEDAIYFGEGMHDNNKSHLYKYDLKKEKIVAQVEINGHIQRAPVVHEDLVIIGGGGAGILAFSKDALKEKWKIEKYKDKKLHVDSNPIVYKEMVCFTSIYDQKGIYCSDIKSGKILFHQELAESPKGELGLSDNLLYGLSTEANMKDLKFDIASHFYVIDLQKKELKHNIKLRGYNFFKPLLVSKDEVMVNLSTGDLLTIDLKEGKIGYIGEFPEPFVSTPFLYEGDLCGIGVMGKLLCYKKGKGQYNITKEKRFFQSPVGEVGTIGGDVYLPSRMGYFKL